MDTTCMLSNHSALLHFNLFLEGYTCMLSNHSALLHFNLFLEGYHLYAI